MFCGRMLAWVPHTPILLGDVANRMASPPNWAGRAAHPHRQMAVAQNDRSRAVSGSPSWSSHASAQRRERSSAKRWL